MKKYYVISEDLGLKKKLSKVLSPEDLVFTDRERLEATKTPEGILLIDGDNSSELQNRRFLKKMHNKRLPLVAIFSELSGKSTMKYLEAGVINIMFKDTKPQDILKKLQETMDNFDYLEKAKMVVEDESRTRSFFNVINSITSDTDINEIILKLLSAMQDIFFFSSTSFYLIFQDQAKKKMGLNSSSETNSDEKHEIIDDKRVINYLRKQKTPIIVNSKSSKTLKEEFKEGTVIIPLVGKNNLIGFITSRYSESHKYIPSKDSVLLKAFAEHTSVALENARLYWDVLKAREELINQEKKALLGQMIVSLNHEINNPLSIISMEAQLLQKKLNTQDTGQNIENRIINIENNIDRIKDILEKISTLKVDSNMSVEYRKGTKMLNLYNEN